MIKQIVKIYLPVFLISVLILACLETESENFGYTLGTIKFISIEGSFFGIVTDDNINLDPINLPQEYKIEGKRIQFKYSEKKDMASFHMWGIIVEITEIKELK